MLEQATAYLVLEDARRAERETVRSELAEEMLALVAAGELGQRALRARLEALGLRPDGALTVIASSNAASDLSYASVGCGTNCVRGVHEGQTVLLAQSADDAVVGEIVGLIREGGTDPVLGVGRAATGPAGLRRALAEALSAHQLALTRPPGERVVQGLEVYSHRQLLDFLDPDVRQSFRECVLGPVQRWDEAHNSHLLETLAVFFANDGHWRRTAAQLHIHHNTLHYRLEKVARLTGRSVESAAARVDYVLALAIEPAGRAANDEPPVQPRGASATAVPRR